MKVAVLDDSGDLVELICLLLSTTAEADCIGAESVADLKARANEVLATDLAVLDVNLGPGVPSGIDAYTWLVQQGYQGRIVFLTGHGATHPLVREALALGGVEVLEKPVEVEEILALVKDSTL